MKKLLQCFAVALGIISAGATASAQELPAYFMTNNNAGTDFYLSFLPAWPVQGGVHNIKLYVSSAVETPVTVEVEGQGWIKQQVTEPNGIIEFDIPVTVAQPYFKIQTDITPPDKVYRQSAVHVSSPDPIIVYGMTRYQYTSDGFLALPVSALGTEYIIASYADVGDNGTSMGQHLPSEAAIVAAFDNTQIVFTLGGTPESRTAGGLHTGESKAFSLNRGDVLSVASLGQYSDLSGSRVMSNKPVGVISGNFCAHVPVNVGACDFITEMEIPAHAWGQEYVITKIFGRQKNSMMKIMAKEPNTTVYRNGVQIGVIAEAGGVEGSGHLHMSVSDGAPDNFIISADKPISVTQFNPGQEYDNVASDPFQLALLPVAQYTDDVVFNTPGIEGGIGFTYNYVNIVFELDDAGEMPDDLEIGIVEYDDIHWRSVKAKYSFNFDPLSQPVDGKEYGVKTILLPGDGVYRLRASRKFAAYLYGFSAYDSYAYPAGALIADITAIDTEPPVPMYSISDDGATVQGTVNEVGSGSFTSNLAKVDLLHAASHNYTFTTSRFIPGVENLATWKLAVVNEAEPASATLLFVDRAGNDTTITLAYSPTTGVREQPVIQTALWPQPAADNATLQFSLPAAAHVQLALFNELGEKTAILLDEAKEAGTHSVTIETSSLAAGVYMYRLTAGATVQSGRLAVVK